MREPIDFSLRADYSTANPDYTCGFRWEDFTAEDHSMWGFLYRRQSELLRNRACPEFLDALSELRFSDAQIPPYDEVSESLTKLTGWKLVVVPGYLPGEVFHEHLAHCRFPVTAFIRRPDQVDYLQEPDIFHDLFGHVPMLAHPVYADYMQAFGRGGVRAHELGHIELLDTLYWFTVEFGLTQTKLGRRIFGAGILSSKGESVYCLESPVPNRIAYDLRRVMRSRYRISEFQKTYFVIDSFEALMASTQPDFAPIYEEVSRLSHIEVGALCPEDRLA